MIRSAAELRAIPLPVDPANYNLSDAAGTVASASQRWQEMLHGLDQVPGGALFALEQLSGFLRDAGGEGDDLQALTEAPYLELRRLGEEHGDGAGLVDSLGAGHPLVDAAVETDRLLSLAGRAVAGDASQPQIGRVERISVSGGGVPKREAQSAMVGLRGAESDKQADRRNHGRVFQALCLYSSEVIEALAREGHPISAGSVGENLTISGLDWTQLRPGTRLALGEESPVVIEVTAWADPCKTIAESFLERDFRRIDFGRQPGWARAYAAVVVPGNVMSGCLVRCLP